MLLFLKGGNTGECRIFQNWFQWRRSTAAACQHCHDSTRVGVADKWQPAQCKDGRCSAKMCRGGQRQTPSGWRRSVNWQGLKFRIKLSDEMRGEKGADRLSLRVFIDLSSIRDVLNTETLISESSSCKHLRNLSTRLRILPLGVRPWILLTNCVLIIYQLRDSPVSVTWLSRCQNKT